MRLRLGQAVSSTDGPFGELVDIIVNPVERTVTHVVVEPRAKQLQARLVPAWLLTAGGDGLVVQLDERHVRQLQRVAFSEFVQPSSAIELSDEWDVGPHEISVPSDGFAHNTTDAERPIPMGDCEIRRQSEVTTSDGRVVGRVEGFVAEEDRLSAVLVRANGVRRPHRNVVVPMPSVARVRCDRIDLDLSRADFASLPHGEGHPRRVRLGPVWERTQQATPGVVRDVQRSAIGFGRQASGAVSRMASRAQAAARKRGTTP